MKIKKGFLKKLKKRFFLDKIAIEKQKVR
jgi:hypothetical protein